MPDIILCALHAGPHESSPQSFDTGIIHPVSSQKLNLGGRNSLDPTPSGSRLAAETSPTGHHSYFLLPTQHTQWENQFVGRHECLPFRLDPLYMKPVFLGRRKKNLTWWMKVWWRREITTHDFPLRNAERQFQGIGKISKTSQYE